MGDKRIMAAQVFISYAHADNQSFDDETGGWVALFVDHLQKAVAMRPGGSRVRCWMDYRLEPQRAVDETLRQRIRDSRCILAFLSPRYLESEWCRKEMETFVELVGNGAASDRVFLVELLPTDREHWHPGIRSITEVKFWSESLEQPEAMILGWPVPNPKADKPYWTQLNRLAAILARQIQNLPPPPETPPPAVPARSDPLPALAPPPPSGPLRLVVNADRPDRDLGREAQRLLDELEVETTLAAEPLPSQEPAKYRRDLETQLEDSHGVLIVYGAAPPSWVQAQHSMARKVLAMQRRGVWGGLLDGPPPEKPDHGILNRSLMLLPCRDGIDPELLRNFVETLRREAGHV
jgi:hypothetical protein